MATFPAFVRVSVRVAAHQPKGLLRTGRLRSGCLARGATAFLAASAARCCASCAQKPSAAEMLKSKVAKGMKRRDMQMLQMDAPDAIAEFQSLKEDPLASWSLLGDQDFQVRVFTVLLLAFLPCAFLASKVYPISDETGQVLPQNIMADASFGFSVAALFLTSLLLRIGYCQVQVNQLLRQRSVYLETGGGGYFLQTKSAANRRWLVLLGSTFAWVH